MKELMNLMRMTQDELYAFLKHPLLERYGKKRVVFGDDWLYAEGDIPVMLVAHMDTVHAKPPEQIFYDQQNKVMWSPQGIGGDDRCGVYAILKLIRDFKPHVMFCKNEETGCKGARIAATKIFPNINFMIEIDRRGTKDVVFYECGNKQFQDYMTNHGFELAYGSCSDISVLAPAYECAACNVSAGYVNEHTATEHVSVKALEDTIAKIAIILSEPQTKKYPYEHKPKTFTNYSYGGDYGYNYGGKGYYAYNSKPASDKGFHDGSYSEDLRLQKFY